MWGDFMIGNWYIIVSALSAIIIAQILKPILTFILTHKWNPKLVFASGGFPSSHSAGVTACALAIGLKDNFSSDLFAVSLILALVIAYDAMNVRYYAGQNIQITRQLIKDLSELSHIKLDDPIYFTKMKSVLGHKGIEVFGGIILGLATAGIFHLFA